MSKQIVISGSRILAHGEDCFLTMGGTVICSDSGRVFQNATVATVDALPADIDSVGYEYHAGEFVPCAPFGIGKGNIAVFCSNDCKALKDSGLSLSNDIAKYKVVEYTGSGTNTMSIAVGDFLPKIALFMAQTDTTESFNAGFIVGSYGIAILTPINTAEHGTYSIRGVTYTENNGTYYINWSGSSGLGALNSYGVNYKVFVIG